MPGQNQGLQIDVGKGNRFHIGSSVSGHAIPGKGKIARREDAALGIVDVRRIEDCGGYPGLVLDANATPVRGEVYRLHSAADLASLDRYEECSPQCPKPTPYRREKVEATFVSGESASVWVYLDNINGGDFP